MNGRYLLDTNIVIAVLNGEPAVQPHLRAGGEMFLSVITVGELLRGARGSQRVESNLARVRELAGRMAVIPCTVPTAESYALVKQQLRSLGRPLPENDIWIAATCRQHGLILVSRDRHFQDVPDLNQVEW